MNSIQANEKTRIREIVNIFSGLEISDGDGVNMTRLIGSAELSDLDPFLLLDVFGSDQALDDMGGFPNHPHRGFETVSYLLAGRMRHKDSAGNEGVIEPGGVQWMTAGKGIVHSEMPEQVNGLLHGFQLWVNLPAKAKMTESGYQEFAASQVPVERWDNGTKIRVIAGKTKRGTVGPVNNTFVNPVYMDISLQSGQCFEQVLNAGDNTFIYVIEGAVEVGNAHHVVDTKHLAVFEKIPVKGLASFRVSAGKARFLLLSGQPLDEPIVRGGPFVMNTQEEIRQAFDDFKHNRF